MKIKSSLRIKLTVVTVLIMTVMCVLLTVISQRASIDMISAIEMTPIDISPIRPALTDSTIIESGASLDAAVIATPAQLVKAQKSFNLITVGAMLLIVLSGGALIYFYVKHELSPLEKLSSQVKCINVENLSAPITVSVTGNEIEQLSLAIEDMASRVSSAYTMQKSFSGAAAHELRTPLASIQARLEVFLLKPNHTKEEYSLLIESVHCNVERLTELVRQLLLLTNQAESNLNQNINLRTVAEEAALDLQLPAAEKNIKISIEGEGEIKGNDCLIQRAIFNLMQNAVRYNTENGKIDVSITKQNGKVCFAVADTCTSIQPEQMDKIFDLFYCVDKSRSRELGGNGLGLAIVKQIATLHSGKISVKSNTPVGNVFELKI